MRQTTVFVTLLALLVPTTALAKNATLAVFLPQLPGVSRPQRLSAAERLARYLAGQSSRKVRGRSFARAADVLNGVRRRRIDVAIVPSYLAASRGWRIAAMLARGATRAGAWKIVARGNVKRVTDLKGKRIVTPRSGGVDRRFVANVLLERELKSSYFRWVGAPDTNSAIKTVKLGGADAAVVPAGAVAGGLTVVYRSRPVAMPVVAAFGPNAKVLVQALMRWRGSWLGFDRFVRPSGVGALRAALLGGRKVKRIVAVRPRLGAMRRRDIFGKADAFADLPSALEVSTTISQRPDDN